MIEKTIRVVKAEIGENGTLKPAQIALLERMDTAYRAPQYFKAFKGKTKRSSRI